MALAGVRAIKGRVPLAAKNSGTLPFPRHRTRQKRST
jgi:hypothetical protein